MAVSEEDHHHLCSAVVVADVGMSFTFQWPRFSDQFHENAIQMLDSALNKGNKPPVIADRIEVVELEMGSQVRVHAAIGIFRLQFLKARSSSPQNWRFGILES